MNGWILALGLTAASLSVHAQGAGGSGSLRACAEGERPIKAMPLVEAPPRWRSAWVRASMGFDTQTGALKEVSLMAFGEPRYAQALKPHLEKHARLQCLPPAETTGLLRLDQVHSYVHDGSARYRLPEYTLQAFSTAVLEVVDQPTQVFDTRTMGCPFTIEWASFQTSSANAVVTDGAYSEARQPLLNWLANVRLRLTPPQRERIEGVPVRIQVTCSRLNTLAAKRSMARGDEFVDTSGPARSDIGSRP